MYRPHATRKCNGINEHEIAHLAAPDQAMALPPTFQVVPVSGAPGCQRLAMHEIRQAPSNILENLQTNIQPVERIQYEMKKWETVWETFLAFAKTIERKIPLRD